MKVSQLMAAVGIAASLSVAAAGAASAAPAPDSSLSCADGALTIVTDDSGVQREACVASAVEVPVAPVAPAQASLTAPARVPATTGATTPKTTGSASTRSLPATGASTGGLVIAALLVGSGSVVSLVSRRKPLGHSKGFRRRRFTP